MLLKEASLKHLSFSCLKAFIIKKPFDFGEVESLKEDADENLTRIEDQSNMSLFNDSPASSVTDTNESGKSQITTGKYILLHEIFFFNLLVLFDIIKAFIYTILCSFYFLFV